MNGTITEIQRFSLNDGPGIRTTVFLKGCNMNCAWCHNPETIAMGKELHFYQSNCISCYKCVTACPSKAHKRIDNQHRFFRNLCIKCGKCAEVCYAEALVMSGRRTGVEAAMAEIVQDKAYYQSSGGGVTISGGEVLCQKDFARALALACKKEDIAVAIETNLSFPYGEMESLLSELALVMCDLKIFDTESHARWVGTDNRLVLENIQKLEKSGIPYIVRTPLVPGATDSEENIRQIAAFLQPFKNLLYYELLNFNPLGESKYKSLGKENPFETARPLPENRLRRLAAIAEEQGLTVKIS
ncbi:MAG: glycyl-radical enzyme activating protein [Oscillospiraceae bacterium]